MVGHCFPFYLKFKGGKELAAFAGFVLAYNPWLFLFLLISGIALTLIVNYSFILPFYVTAFFTIYVAVREESIAMHFGNFMNATREQNRKIREYIKTKLFHSGNAE